MAESFSSGDIEIFLSTLPGPCVVTWPHEARQKIIIVSSNGKQAKVSETFCNTDGWHCELAGLEFLEQCMKEARFTSPQEVVFVQNYGPCLECANLLNDYKENNKNTKITIVYVKEYSKDGLEILSDTIHQFQMTSWRWIAFLLWNLGKLVHGGKMVRWWQGEYDQHKEVINEGLKRCETNTAWSAKYHMTQLLKKNGLGTKSETINVFRYKSYERYTLDEIVDKVNPSYLGCFSG